MSHCDSWQANLLGFCCWGQPLQQGRESLQFSRQISFRTLLSSVALGRTTVFVWSSQEMGLTANQWQQERNLSHNGFFFWTKEMRFHRHKNFQSHPRPLCRVKRCPKIFVLFLSSIDAPSVTVRRILKELSNVLHHEIQFKCRNVLLISSSEKTDTHP